jgi:LacI family transcriptional regulator
MHNSKEAMGKTDKTTVSMEEISERLGVSAMTVSRTLNAKSPPTRADALKTYNQIRKLADELGYRKSTAPRAMLTGKYHAITVLGSTQWRKNHMPQTRLRGLQEASETHGLALNFARLDDESLICEDTIPKILQNFVSDGLLVNYVSGYPQSLDEILCRYRIPAIWMNSKHEYDCIYLDDLQGSKHATDYLLSLGHRRIGYWLLDSAEYASDIHYGNEPQSENYLFRLRIFSRALA